MPPAEPVVELSKGGNNADPTSLAIGKKIRRWTTSEGGTSSSSASDCCRACFRTIRFHPPLAKSLSVSDSPSPAPPAAPVQRGSPGIFIEGHGH